MGTPDFGRNRALVVWILAPSNNYVIIFIAYHFLSDSNLHDKTYRQVGHKVALKSKKPKSGVPK